MSKKKNRKPKKKGEGVRNLFHFEIQRSGTRANVHKNKKAYDRNKAKDPKEW